jgi:RNA polymerase sigma-70 factor (ECF subfamily)
MEDLCRAYWFPLYAYVRRRGYGKEDAEDLTQTFFARFLEINPLAGLQAERGRFRAYLLASLKHFLSNTRDHANARKRGGGAVHLSLDWQNADKKFQLVATEESSPDKAFDREWAVELLDNVIGRLRDECRAEGRERLFDVLKSCLVAAKNEMPHAESAARLGVSEGAVRVAAHRLRQRYRCMLRDEIARTLADPAQIDEELQALFGAFS